MLSAVVFRGRKLTWQTNMGTVDLKAQFDRRYDLQVSKGHQAVSCCSWQYNEAQVPGYLASEGEACEENLPM